MTVEYSIDIKRSEERSTQRTYNSTQDLPPWYVNISTLTNRSIDRKKNRKNEARLPIWGWSKVSKQARRSARGKLHSFSPSTIIRRKDGHHCDGCLPRQPSLRSAQELQFFCQLVCRFSLLKVALIFTAKADSIRRFPRVYSIKQIPQRKLHQPGHPW